MGPRRLQVLRRAALSMPGALVAILYTILGGSIVAILERGASLNVVNSFAGLQVVLLLVLAFVIYMVHRIESRVDDLHKRSKLVVDYYANSEDELVAAKRIVASLKDGASIRIVTSFIEAETPGVPWRDLWYSAIQGSVGTIHYHRIIQLQDVTRDGERPLYELLSPSYLKHFRGTLLARSRLRDTRHITRIDAVPARYPITFVIVQNPGAAPGGTLIVSMNQYAQTKEGPASWTMAGSFVIDDPDGQLVPHFESLFNGLASADGLRPITLDELQGPAIV